MTSSDVPDRRKPNFTDAGSNQIMTTTGPGWKDSFGDATVRLLELPLILFSYFLALSAIVLRIGVNVSMSFETASWWILGGLVVSIALLTPNLVRISRQQGTVSFDYFFLIATSAISAVSAFLAVAINRPDIDDSIYASKAVFYVANPQSPLDRTITWIADLPGPVQALDLQYYETTQAAVAWLLGAHFLQVYHIIFPAIAGFLMCLALVLVLHVFDSRKWACLCGVAFLLMVFLSLGETHMAFGNLSLARAFHAKYVFISVLVPCWIYFSLQFLTTRKWTSWCALLAIGAGIVGSTTTALVFLPLLSFLLVVAFMLASPRPFAVAKIVTGVYYGVALLPVLASALQFFLVARDRVASGTAISAGYPVDFYGQLSFLINPDAPLTPALFIVSCCAILAFSPYRRFFAIWIGLCFLLFLNPLVSRMVMTYVAPETIYWRLFYLLPFTVIAGLAYMMLIRPRPLWRAMAVAVYALAMYLGLFGPTSIVRSENGSQLDWPRYKIDKETLAVITEIAAAIPKATMFAPQQISSNMLIYSAAHPQVHMREDYLGFVLVPPYQADFAKRVGAFRFLYQDDATAKPALEALLTPANSPQVIVLDSTAQRDEVRKLLESRGYAFKPGKFGNYMVYIKL